MQDILGTRALSRSNLLAISLDLLEDGDGERGHPFCTLDL